MFGRIALILMVAAIVMILWPILRDVGERLLFRRRRFEEELEAARRHPEPEKQLTPKGEKDEH